MSQTINLVIGAGGIGQAVAKALASQGRTLLLTRQSGLNVAVDGVEVKQLNTASERDVEHFAAGLIDERYRLRHVVCTTGLLHDASSTPPVTPEKKLEDISSKQLLAYFEANTVVPALWLKALVDIMHPQASTFTCVSARVGSISDNRLGGWYGYRASKAALNMLVKTAAVEYARRASATTLLCYHPGTVDTPLSKPFQRNVPAEKLFTPDFSASRLIDLLDNISAEQSPCFMDWDHKPVSW